MKKKPNIWYPNIMLKALTVRMQGRGPYGPPLNENRLLQENGCSKNAAFLSVSKFLSLAHSKKKRIEKDAFFAEINKI